MTEKPYEDVRIEGHLIDSLMVPQIMDDVMDLEGEFEILSFDVGRTQTDISRAVIRIHGRDRAHLEEILTAVQEHGAVAVAPEDAVLAPAPADGVFPDEFYSTTNLETFVRLDGEWLRVEGPEMDCGVRVRPAAGPGGPHAETLPLCDVAAGELFVVGHHGIRVVPLARPRESQPFEFMASAVSSEKPKAQIVREVARLLRRVRDEGKLTIAVVGPAVVHTGSAAQLARLIRAGLRRRPVRRQRGRHPRHRIEPLRHLAGHRHEDRHAHARRPRAPPAGDQHHPPLRRHRRRHRPGRARARASCTRW